MIERDKFYFNVFCVTFWVMAVGGFVFEEILPFLEPFKLSLILFSDIVFLFLGLATLQQKGDRVLIVTFFLLAILSSVVNHIPALVFFNGFRDYIAFLFALPIVRYFFTCDRSEEFRDSIDRQLRIFLILQAFCIVEEFIRYGAGDYVGGSLGKMNSGIISICIIYISFYFVTKNWGSDSLLQNIKNNKLYIFLLFPVFLNETKISLVLLLVYFFLLIPFKTQSIGKTISYFFFIIVLLGVMIVAYTLATGGSQDITSNGFIEDYLTGGENAEEIMDLAETAIDYVEEATDTWDESDWAYIDVPRVMKLPLLVSALEDSDGGLFIGAGIGHLKGGNTLDKTEFATNHLGLLFGTQMMLIYIGLPLGILGLIWFFFWYKHVLLFRKRCGEKPLQIKLFILILVIGTLIYQDVFRYIIPSIVIYYISLTTIYPRKNESNVQASGAVNNSTGLQG